jgi:hypothetical protein
MHTVRALPTSAASTPRRGCLCYAAVWQERDAPVCAGLVEVGPQSLRLAGISTDRRVLEREVAYDDLTGVRIGRAPEERLRGLPVLVLELGAQTPPIEVGTLNGLGTLTELADLVAGRFSDRRQATAEGRAATPVVSS